jgi:hypothetical protein
MDEAETGRFCALDPFELLMMFDILVFAGTLASFAVFLLRGTLEDEDFEEFIKLPQE